MREYTVTQRKPFILTADQEAEVRLARRWCLNTAARTKFSTKLCLYSVRLLEDADGTSVLRCRRCGLVMFEHTEAAP